LLGAGVVSRGFQVCGEPLTRRPIKLDPAVDVCDDDAGRIVLLPRDDRSPVRLPREDASFVAHLQRGELDINGRGVHVNLDGAELRRFAMIVRSLDQQGLLDGHARARGPRIVRWNRLTLAFDRAAQVLTTPFVHGFGARMRHLMLLSFTVAIVLSLVLLWWKSGGRLFAGALTAQWWAGVGVFLILFPIVHEFSHAWVARLFGLQVTGVGAQHAGGMHWSPFVEVRRAVLSSDPAVRIWIPLAGVLCNLCLALVFGALFMGSDQGSWSHGIAGVALLMAHARVLIDAGYGIRTDATQALRAARELLPPSEFRHWKIAIRGGHLVFALSTAVMLALSLGGSGGEV
jgi:hypothetical protein